MDLNVVNLTVDTISSQPIMMSKKRKLSDSNVIPLKSPTISKISPIPERKLYF